MDLKKLAICICCLIYATYYTMVEMYVTLVNLSDYTVTTNSQMDI